MQCYSVLISQAQHKNATETDLRREFETFGTIERVRIVRDKKNRSRGYAFIVYERERDMKGTFVLIWFQISLLMPHQPPTRSLMVSI